MDEKRELIQETIQITQRKFRPFDDVSPAPTAALKLVNYLKSQGIDRVGRLKNNSTMPEFELSLDGEAGKKKKYPTLPPGHMTNPSAVIVYSSDPKSVESMVTAQNNGPAGIRFTVESFERFPNGFFPVPTAGDECCHPGNETHQTIIWVTKHKPYNSKINVSDADAGITDG